MASKTLKFNKNENNLTITYAPYNSDVNFIYEEIESADYYVVRKVFTITQEIIISNREDIEFIEFIIGELDGEYYHINKSVLDIDFDIYIHKSCNINEKYFLTTRNVSIFRILNKKIGLTEPVFIGGDNENSISEEEYISIIKSLPNDYELNRYAESRVCTKLKCFFNPKKDVETLFNKYVKSKELDISKLSEINFEDFDLQRYEYLLDKLKDMLKNQEEYGELHWQQEIIKFIKIIFPKYVISVEKARIKKQQGIIDKEKEIDILLADYNGYVDIIEIKKPADIELFYKTKNRDNYIQTRYLSGAIMQAEKYIYYLTKGGKKVEDDLNEQFKQEKPDDYFFKVANPKSLIIMGRTNNYSKQQQEDLEIIKRKYKNVIDIISYDDLIQRLETIIKMLKKFNSN